MSQAKDKAKELVSTYYKLLNYEFGDLVYSLRDKQPQQCALICVDMMLQELPKRFDSEERYWEKVKQEIEKL